MTEQEDNIKLLSRAKVRVRMNEIERNTICSVQAQAGIPLANDIAYTSIMVDLQQTLRDTAVRAMETDI